MRRYVVYGAGAVGGTIAARLSESGYNVLLIARGPHHDAITAEGLRFESPDGVAMLPVPVVRDPGEVDFTEGDIVVLSVKSQDTEGAVRALAAAVHEPLPLLCAQNGVANERTALRLFPDVYGLRVNLPASHLRHGVVRAHASPVYGLLDIGRYPAGEDALAASVASDLMAAGFISRADPSIMRWKYYKLLANLQNTVDACCDASGDGAAELRELVRAEGTACLRAARLDVATAAEEQARLDSVGSRVSEAVGYPGNSSWQSLARGQETEVDFLNGEIVLLGRLHGVATPVNAALQAAMHRVARDATGPERPTAADLLREAHRESRNET